jgi:hypothetical protein
VVFTVVALLEECRLKIVLFQKIPILYSLFRGFLFYSATQMKNDSVEEDQSKKYDIKKWDLKLKAGV